jgi:hypothetical protein
MEDPNKFAIDFFISECQKSIIDYGDVMRLVNEGKIREALDLFDQIRVKKKHDDPPTEEQLQYYRDQHERKHRRKKKK